MGHVGNLIANFKFLFVGRKRMQGENIRAGDLHGGPGTFSLWGKWRLESHSVKPVVG